MDPATISQPGSDEWYRRLLRDTEKLQRQLDGLRATIGKYGATYTENGITLNGGDLVVGDGGAIEMANPPRDDGTPTAPLLHVGDIGDERGILMSQPDGTPIAIFASDGSSIIDGRGNDVLATDRETGYGLSSPVQTWDMIKNYDEYRSTTGGVFWHGYGALTHSRIRFTVQVQVYGPATFTARINFDGEDRNDVRYERTAGPTTVSAGSWIWQDYIHVDEIPEARPGHFVRVSVWIFDLTGDVGMIQPTFLLGAPSSQL